MTPHIEKALFKGSLISVIKVKDEKSRKNERGFNARFK
jgi:hypothetical protein